MRRWILAFSVLPLSGALGCSSDADDKENSDNGSLDTKLVRDLTVEEAATLCQQNTDKFATLISAVCTGQAWLTSEADVNLCMMNRDICIQDPQWDNLDCNSFNPAETGSCPMTVAQLKACLAESLQVAPTITCDATDPADPPACVETLVNQCLPEMTQ